MNYANEPNALSQQTNKQKIFWPITCICVCIFWHKLKIKTDKNFKISNIGIMHRIIGTMI